MVYHTKDGNLNVTGTMKEIEELLRKLGKQAKNAILLVKQTEQGFNGQLTGETNELSAKEGGI